MMNQKMYDLCNWAVQIAKKHGATDCKARFNKRRFVEVNYRERRPESIKEATTQKLSLDIFVGKRFSGQSTPDLRKPALEAFIKKVIENAQFIEEDPFRYLPEASLYKGRKELDLGLSDIGHSNFTAKQRHELAKEIEAACLDKGADKVISVEAGEYDDYSEEVVVNSKGFAANKTTTQYWVGASMTAKGEGERRPNGYHWVGARKKDDLPNTSSIGIRAAERSLELLGSKKIATETLPIIIENRTSGRVLGGFMNAMYGRNIQQKRSFLADLKGEKVGSDKFTLIDNPFLVKGMGSRLYDGDGFPAKKLIPVENGVLNDFYIDWYYSRKLDVAPTTGWPSNLSISQGDRSVKEIMKDLGRGIVINGFIGGNSNSATGDFSVGIIGHLFENGEKVQAISEMNIADNHLTFWNKLIETANDPWKYGSWNMPSLVFEDVVVSGV